MIKALRLNAADNVATLLEDAGKGETVLVISEQNETLGELELLQAIPFGNKVALRPMKPEDHLIKGGVAVGKAIKPVPQGQLAHVQNIRSLNLDIPEVMINEIITQMEIEVD
ncbi:MULTISPECIES: SAF domain-containing protein [Pseudovibrio]|uniref:Altronate dehydratase small subunit n=1 Tax=Pseudovibrio ascidiaceicola TaxID=285279 RepID=A0A1I3YS29_9HYPH|nr:MULTISPECIES: SAF domain-containing protein [Pseudovibrio]KZL15541.1 (2R)-sulfolactate sulfo-lyase subunit alpha [Pseudovibrio sp. Ad26]SFK34159.1 altronate dehydratase small subunit [Pseudovibrio ascidiaceicola]